MKRNRNWRDAGFAVSVRRGDGKLYTQEEAFRPVAEAFDQVRDIGRERASAREGRVIFDSGWYEHRPGDPLPPIESFRISSR